MVETSLRVDVPEYQLPACCTDQQQALCIYLQISDTFLVLSQGFPAGPSCYIPKTNLSVVQAYCSHSLTHLNNAINNPLAFLRLSFLCSIMRIDRPQLLVIPASHQVPLRDCQRTDRVLHRPIPTSDSCVTATSANSVPSALSTASCPVQVPTKTRMLIVIQQEGLQLMLNETQFKIARGKANFGGSHSLQRIADLLGEKQEVQGCHELRVLHCPQLNSIQGIEVCKGVKSLNLSCNAIEDLTPLRGLTLLESLDVKANRIRSLRGIEHLRKLVKVDASQNRIETLEGFGEGNSQIQCIVLYKNALKDLGELSRLRNFKQIVEISFERGNGRSNPFCQDKEEYYNALQPHLQSSKTSLKKIDDLSPKEVAQFFAAPQEQSLSHNSDNNNTHSNMNHSQMQPLRTQPVYANTPHQQPHLYTQSPHLFAQTAGMAPLASQKLMLMTQRQADLQRIISLKEQSLEEMRHRYAQLQLANTNQFRQSLRKQAEFQRAAGQVAELSRGLDQKDQKISELQRRVQELLKAAAAQNALTERRSLQMEALRRELGDAKLESAQLRAVNKEQQGRLRELQGKALASIEQKSSRLQQARGKQEQANRENRDLRQQCQQYKDRVRQLTQLLKEWQEKYEHTVRQLQAYHRGEKEQIINELEGKLQETSRRWEERQRAIMLQWEEKVKTVEGQYSSALENALEKYTRLKRAYDDKNSSQNELKNLYKALTIKNTQNQATLRQYQQALIKTKKAILSLTADNDSLARQHGEMKTKLQSEIRILQGELAKSHFARQKAERDARQLRAANQFLQKSLDNLSIHQKELEELQEKCDAFQATIEAKNVMLDDKNDTIEKLKADLQVAAKQAQEGKVDIKKYQKLSEKYERQKAIVKQLQDQNRNLERQAAELQTNRETLGTLEQEFKEVREIMHRQGIEIREKEQLNHQLVSSLEKLKHFSQNLAEEGNSLRNEKGRLLHSLQEKQAKFTRIIRQRESQYERKLSAAQQETSKYRQITEQFKSFTKTLNF